MRALSLLCLMGALAGCGAVPGELSHEYGKNVRKVGMFPVYPPREEFQIGDIYIWSQAVDNPNDSVSVYLDTLDWMRGEADAFMATRVVFENTTVAAAGKPAVRTDSDIPGTVGTIATRGELGFGSKLQRSLPIAAFPTVTADAGFTAGLGIVQGLTALGLAGGARTRVTLISMMSVPIGCPTFWSVNLRKSSWTRRFSTTRSSDTVNSDV